MINISDTITAKDVLEYFSPPISHVTRTQAGEMLGITARAVDRICIDGINIDGVNHKLTKLANGTIDYNEVFLLKKKREKSKAQRNN